MKMKDFLNILLRYFLSSLRRRRYAANDASVDVFDLQSYVLDENFM